MGGKVPDSAGTHPRLMHIALHDTKTPDFITQGYKNQTTTTKTEGPRRAVSTPGDILKSLGGWSTEWIVCMNFYWNSRRFQMLITLVQASWDLQVPPPEISATQETCHMPSEHASPGAHGSQ